MPSKPTAMKRLIHLLSFSISSFIPVLGSVFWKPDVVIQVVPTLFCSIPTLLLTKLVRAKSVIHIQDYEIDAMFELSIAKTRLFKKNAHWLEKKILNCFTIVSTISKGMLDRASKKGVDEKKLLFFPNWSEVALFENQSKDAKFLIDMGINPEKKLVLYSGNMGEKQGLELVVHAANCFKKNHDVQFLMIGDGVAKEKLEKLSSDLNLANISFLSLFYHTESCQIYLHLQTVTWSFRKRGCRRSFTVKVD